MSTKLSLSFSLSVILASLSCNTDLGKLWSKADLAYLACTGSGFSDPAFFQLEEIYQDFKNDGVSFTDAVTLSISVCDEFCAGDSDCLDSCHACLGPMAEMVYYPDGRPLNQSLRASNQTFNLKMPLPGGKSWLLTTEAGGTDCASSVRSPSHTGVNYYSLDFDDYSFAVGVVNQEYAVPVYAAAGGVVMEVPTIAANGNYVVIDHENGYSTRYLHLRDTPLVYPGQKVVTGTMLGIMGSTGESSGTHLHFGIRFHNDGSSGVPELQKVTIEGLTIEKYKTSCNSSGLYNAYYSSTNPS